MHPLLPIIFFGAIKRGSFSGACPRIFYLLLPLDEPGSHGKNSRHVLVNRRGPFMVHGRLRGFRRPIQFAEIVNNDKEFVKKQLPPWRINF